MLYSSNDIGDTTCYLEKLNKESRLTVIYRKLVIKEWDGRDINSLRLLVVGVEMKIVWLKKNLRCTFTLIHYKQKDPDRTK